VFSENKYDDDDDDEKLHTFKKDDGKQKKNLQTDLRSWN